MSEVDPDRDPKVDAAWRAQSREEPPAALDDAIRAAAHRAVHAQPAATTARARSAWPVWAGFAAAASIGAIAIGVWQLQPREVDETKVVASDVPRASPAAPQAARRDAAPAAGKATASDASAMSKALDDAQRRVLTAPGLPPEEVDRKALAAASPHPTDERQRATEPVAQNAPAAAAPAAVGSMQPRTADAANKPSPFPGAGAAAPHPSPLPASRSEGAPAAGAQANAPAAPRAQRAAETSTATPAAARVAKSAPAEKQASAKTTGDYITAIRRARAEHREADARAELTAMRAEFQFADAALPPDLSEWAKGVPRAAR